MQIIKQKLCKKISIFIIFASFLLIISNANCNINGETQRIQDSGIENETVEDIDFFKKFEIFPDWANIYYYINALNLVSIPTVFGMIQNQHGDFVSNMNKFGIQIPQDIHQIFLWSDLIPVSTESTEFVFILTGNFPVDTIDKYFKKENEQSYIYPVKEIDGTRIFLIEEESFSVAFSVIDDSICFFSSINKYEDAFNMINNQVLIVQKDEYEKYFEKIENYDLYKFISYLTPEIINQIMPQGNESYSDRSIPDIRDLKSIVLGLNNEFGFNAIVKFIFKDSFKYEIEQNIDELESAASALAVLLNSDLRNMKKSIENGSISFRKTESSIDMIIRMNDDAVSDQQQEIERRTTQEIQ